MLFVALGETLFCMLVCSAGYLIRDGWPATGYTNKMARPLGALLAGFATLPVTHNLGVSSGWALATLVSFYTDQKHAEGQQARNLQDAEYLAVSGLTSIAPYLVAGYLLLPVAYSEFFFLSAAFLKPAIWFGSWRLFDRGLGVPAYWTQPTRMAAIFFGAYIGLLISLLSRL